MHLNPPFLNLTTPKLSVYFSLSDTRCIHKWPTTLISLECSLSSLLWLAPWIILEILFRHHQCLFNSDRLVQGSHHSNSFL
uniref:Uncharacterized protein n=1 Tax=Salix viminalis TaxID=40686 RepID=A0A6N2LV99_SALVM